jgi:hypothetical protein
MLLSDIFPLVIIKKNYKMKEELQEKVKKQFSITIFLCIGGFSSVDSEDIIDVLILLSAEIALLIMLFHPLIAF